jgi:Transposase IS4
MIPFKGRIFFRQYIPRKPHSTGIKYWALVDEAGYLYFLEIYTGRKSRQRNQKKQAQSALAFTVLQSMEASVVLFDD